MKRAIPIEYIRPRHDLTWSEIELGLREGWLSSEDVIAFAASAHQEGAAAVENSEIAAISPEEPDRLLNVVGALAAREGSTQDAIRIAWLRILVAWVYDNRTRFPNPLGILEGLYADFDYPDEIHHLIPFNVPSDGYRPQDHTHEENIARLMSMWGEYVDQHMLLRPERNG